MDNDTPFQFLPVHSVSRTGFQKDNVILGQRKARQPYFVSVTNAFGEKTNVIVLRFIGLSLNISYVL